jgi:hypothetical protein
VEEGKFDENGLPVEPPSSSPKNENSSSTNNKDNAGTDFEVLYDHVQKKSSFRDMYYFYNNFFRTNNHWKELTSELDQAHFHKVIKEKFCE